MSITSLADAEDAVRAVGLDVDALALIVSEALGEDLGGRGVLRPGTGAGFDVTSVATVAPDAVSDGQFVVRRPGTLAGLSVAAYTVATVCGPAGTFALDPTAADGDRVVRGDEVMRVRGNTRALLTAERVALNLLTMMSGVATATSAWVDALAGTRTQVRDSRKTIPGLRMLQKYAVRVGGGVNHRMSLADQALIKDNHVIAAGGVVEAFTAVRQAFPGIHVQVEVTDADQAYAVVAAGADDVLLDNMTPDQMAAVVAQLNGRAVFEASGGLNIADVYAVARTGVDYVAVGAITHSAPILDVALDFAS